MGGPAEIDREDFAVPYWKEEVEEERGGPRRHP